MTPTLCSFVGICQAYRDNCNVQAEIGQRQQAAALFKEALLVSPDDWTCLQQYLDCVILSPLQHNAADASSAEAATQLATAVTHSSLQDGAQVSPKSVNEARTAVTSAVCNSCIAL